MRFLETASPSVSPPGTASVPIDPDRVGVTRANARGVYHFAAFPQLVLVR